MQLDEQIVQPQSAPSGKTPGYKRSITTVIVVLSVATVAVVGTQLLRDNCVRKFSLGPTGSSVEFARCPPAEVGSAVTAFEEGLRKQELPAAKEAELREEALHKLRLVQRRLDTPTKGPSDSENSQQVGDILHELRELPQRADPSLRH